MRGPRGAVPGVVSRVAFATAAVMLGAAVAAGAQAAATSGGAKPNWLLIPGFWPSGSGPDVAGAASGRGWVGFPRDDGGSRSMVLGSLRRSGGKLSFAKTVLAASHGGGLIVGSDLYYHYDDKASGKPGELRRVPLLANGRLGTPGAVAGDPERIPPEEYEPLVEAGVQAGNRLVWVLSGTRGGINAQLDFLWACCSSTGQLSDLSRFIDRKRAMRFLQLGRDTKGRVWLAWLAAFPRKVWGAVRLIELDPQTLAPRSPKITTPSPESWMQPRLVCAAACRIVAMDLGGAIISWAPGERSVTVLRLGERTNPATLLDAHVQSAHLVLAISTRVDLKKPPWRLDEIAIVRADARGAHPLRVASAAPAPFAANSPFQWQPPINASFVSGGLVYFKRYLNFRDQEQTRVLLGFLPFR